MQEPTLKQACHVLSELRRQKVDKDKLQKLFSTGLLPDLLSVDPDKVNRDDFRVSLGLDVDDPLLPTIKINPLETIHTRLKKGDTIIHSVRNHTIQVVRNYNSIDAMLFRYDGIDDKRIFNEESLNKSTVSDFLLGFFGLHIMFFEKDRSGNMIYQVI